MIVAGFGFREAATEASFVQALQAAMQSQHGDVMAFATHAAKAGAAPLTVFAKRLNVPVVAIDAEHLRQVPTVTCSSASRAAYGTGSVAEAAALVAAGRNARLIATRQISDDRLATCALAEGDGP